MIIKVIGAGGIGSYLIRELYTLHKTSQLMDASGKPVVIEAYDPDEIEQKNLLYQNYTTSDLYDNKGKRIADKYPGVIGFDTKVQDFKKIIKNKDDMVISCVDNKETRLAMFEQLESLPNIWIDLRSHGRTIACYVKSKKNTFDNMKKTLPDKVEKGEDSCQLSSDLAAGIVQMGNRIIATIGAQMVLNVLRKEDFTSSYEASF